MRNQRKVYWFIPVCATMGALAGPAGCGSGSAPRAVADGNRDNRPDVRLFFGSDLHGYLEPCGCQSRPLGGLDRAAVVVAEARRTAGASLAIVGGATFFDHAEIDRLQEGQDRLRAETMAEILDRLGVVAVVPGPEDLALGPAELARLARGRRFSLVASNAAPRPPLQAELIRDLGGVRVGIFGLTSLGEAVATSDPTAAARSAVERLREGGARLVIGVASLGRPAATQVARAVTGIDFLLIAGARQYPPPPPQKIGETTLLFGGKHGHGIGVLDIWLREGDRSFVDVGDQSAQAAVERVDRRIADLETRLLEWQRSKSASPAELADMRDKVQALRRERAQLGRRERPRDRSAFASRWEELGPERARDPAIRSKIDQYDRRVAELNRAALAAERPVPAVEGRPTYSGGAACVDCHEAAERFWRTTKHSLAYETLETGGKHLDLNCVGCHVTGYRRPGGSTALHVDAYKDVQCESCHGPGSAHVDASGGDEPRTLVRATPESTCVQCHNPEHSDQFNYRTYLARILGPGHGQPER